jgi:hypothetical protein
MTTNTTLVLNYITLNPGVTERDLARKFFSNRVLPARQALQACLWSGAILPCGGGYRVPQATTVRLEALQALPVSDAFYVAYAAF